MKNELRITSIHEPGGVAKYTVQDAHTVYIITTSEAVANNTYQLLKQEYNREKQNASQV